MLRRFISPVLMLIVVLVGCEDDIAAPRGVEEPFSMYGNLNPRRTTQTIMVSPTRRSLDDYSKTIDAVVTSTDLSTGEMITWEDSSVTGARGQIDHVYYADFLPPFGRSYLVEVVRSDGATTRAEAHVPEFVDVTSVSDDEQNLDIVIQGEAFHLLRLDVVYEGQIYERFGPRCEEDTLYLARNPISYTVPYLGKEKAVSDGYRIRLNIAFDHLEMERLMVGNPAKAGIALMGLRAELLVAEKAWNPPDGVFEANVLADPHVMTNAMNGFGLVVGGYNHDASVIPPQEVIVATRFLDGFIRPPQTGCPTYCKCLEQVEDSS